MTGRQPDGLETRLHVISSNDMGAAPPDKPEGFDKSDVIFYAVMALLFAFAIIASKWC